MKNKLTLIIGLAIMLAALPVHAQQTAAAPAAVYVGGGPSVDALFNVTVGVCTDSTTDCALLDYAGHGSIKDLKSMTYTTTVGERHVMMSSQFGGGRVDLFTLVDVGASMAGVGPTFTAGGGGGITFHPAKAPNWGVSVAAEGAYTKADGSTSRNLFFQVGYTFHRR